MDPIPRNDAAVEADSPALEAFEKHANLYLSLLLVVVLTLAGWQGVRMRRIRESELFYRWILAQAIQTRVLQGAASSDTDAHGKRLKDAELFQQITDRTEGLLSHVTLTDKDVDQSEKPLSRLAVAIRDQTDDPLIWSLARGPALGEERQAFLRYTRDGLISPVSSQFDPNAVYGEGGADVSLSNVFFGFRKVAANLVWMQVDRYWHQGMMHRMVPLMKTCVMLDPNFVEAYQLGAWHLAYNATAKMLDTPEPQKKWSPKYKVRLGEKELYYYQAIDFLKDGIWKNTRDYRLYFDLGFGIYKQKLKDYPNAVLYLSEAIRNRHDRWVPRQLYQCLELNKQYEEALAGWEDYLAKNPKNDVARRFILRNKGRIKERDAEKAFERAKSTQDPIQAQVSRDEGERLYQEARAIYSEMNEPFATGRLLRMDAVNYIEQGQYLEAIALLEHARWESNDVWDEASDMIIETKPKAGVPLSQSEKMAIERKKEAEKYKNMPPPETGA
jgi:hypothetical protein